VTRLSARLPDWQMPSSGKSQRQARTGNDKESMNLFIVASLRSL
jgi:hypothetical protein